MNNIFIKRNQNELHLKLSQAKKSNLAIRLTGGLALGIFLIPILLIPILEVQLTLGTFLVIALNWVVAGYLGRLYLWNKYGVENFFITKKKIKIVCDYKLFKDTIGEYEFENIEVLFFQDKKLMYAEPTPQKTYRSKYSCIVFKVDEEYIKSVNKLPILNILDIAKRLRQL